VDPAPRRTTLRLWAGLSSNRAWTVRFGILQRPLLSRFLLTLQIAGVEHLAYAVGCETQYPGSLGWRVVFFPFQGEHSNHSDVLTQYRGVNLLLARVLIAVPHTGEPSSKGSSGPRTDLWKVRRFSRRNGTFT
jgi:hypothetical protein